VKFERITRRRGHSAVLKTLELALTLPLVAIKVNVVTIRDVNDAEVLDFVEMTKNMPISVRFIEFMPFTGQSGPILSGSLKILIYLGYEAINGTRARWLTHPKLLNAFGLDIRTSSVHLTSSMTLHDLG
jgi:protein gp37